MKTSVASNKDLVKSFVEATNRRDWSALDALVAVDFVRHSSSGPPGVDSLEKLKQFHQAELETFPDLRETVLLLVEEGEYVAARINFHGTQVGKLGPFPPSNRTLNADFNCIFRVADGCIQESWVEYDNLYGLIQLGHYALPT